VVGQLALRLIAHLTYRMDLRVRSTDLLDTGDRLDFRVAPRP